jgi:hypothetical protein
MAAHPKKKSVDEIWRELNAKPAFPRSRTTGVAGFGIPGVTTHTRVLPKSQPSGAQHATHIAGDDASCSRDAHRPAGISSSYDPAAAGVTQQELQQCVSTLQRTLNCLADPDRGVRKNAVAALQTKLLRGDAATPKASGNMLQVGGQSPAAMHTQVAAEGRMAMNHMSVQHLVLHARVGTSHAAVAAVCACWPITFDANHLLQSILWLHRGERDPRSFCASKQKLQST